MSKPAVKEHYPIDATPTPIQRGPEVIWAKLHTGIFIPPGQGAKGGNYKDTLSNIATGPDRNLKMYVEGPLLILDTQGVQVGIPLTNVINLVFKK